MREKGYVMATKKSKSKAGESGKKTGGKKPAAGSAAKPAAKGKSAAQPAAQSRPQAGKPIRREVGGAVCLLLALFGVMNRMIP